MASFANIFWLGTKELRSFVHDYVLVGLVIWAFSLAIYVYGAEQLTRTSQWGDRNRRRR